MHLKIKYLLLVLVILVIELLVATTFSNLNMIRGNLGDFLVVILLYYLIKLFHNISSLHLSIWVFIIACIVEISQYFHLAEVLELRRGTLLNTLMGNTFSWLDLLMYFLGCLTAYFSDIFYFLKFSKTK